jgi:hypothetical protein
MHNKLYVLERSSQLVTKLMPLEAIDRRHAIRLRIALNDQRNPKIYSGDVVVSPRLSRFNNQ